MLKRSPSPVVRASRGFSWAPVLFLLVFLVVLGCGALLIVEPMLRKAATASVDERRRLAAYSALFVCVMLLILLVGLTFTIRVGRAMRIQANTERKPTTYPDAWAESARRVEPPDAEELEEPTEDEDNPSSPPTST